MKAFFRIIIILAIVAFAVPSVRHKLENEFGPTVSPIWNEAKNLFNQAKDKILGVGPCDKPITYDIGTFDTKFGISEETFRSALSLAESIWEDSYGKQLFEYKAGEGDLKINLVYDYRQEATSKLKKLGLSVDENQESYDTIRAKYSSLKSEYETETKNYEKMLASYNTQKDAYEKQVEYWNSKGGAPKSEYQKLKATSEGLQMDALELGRVSADINHLVDSINAVVVVLNRLADVLNISVREYNSINQTRGETFEEGEYVSDADGERINIYEFSDKNKLIRVLAHEMGHALGLEHNDDSKAIMYKFNEGTSLSLTDADISSLKTLCEAN